MMANKSSGFKFFVIACLAALVAVIAYVTRGGDVLTKVTPVVTGLYAAGIILSVLLVFKDMKPLEIVPFVLYLAALLVFIDTEIGFIGNLLWATDGNSLDAGFIAVAVCGLIAVICGIVAGCKGIEKEAA
ncbi:MAG: hypothetical protein IKQ96_03035 [Lachnospiraceae bacterium]|nr:hypothetical protein [Lachnospiraceae bacterium]